MQNVSDLVPGEDLKVLIFSWPGAGKTELAGTWPRPVFVDTDFGIATLNNRRFKDLYPNQNIRYKQFSDEVDE